MYLTICSIICLIIIIFFQFLLLITIVKYIYSITAIAADKFLLAALIGHIYYIIVLLFRAKILIISFNYHVDVFA